jgi:hypothetical protein
MWSAMLNVGGWVLFYCGLLLYVVWVAQERTFFADRDSERWSPETHDAAGSAVGDPRPLIHFASATPLGRAAGC